MTLWGWDLYPEIGLGAHVRCRSDRGHFICPFVGSGVDNDTWGPVCYMCLRGALSLGGGGHHCYYIPTQVIDFYLSGLRSNYSIHPEN